MHNRPLVYLSVSSAFILVFVAQYLGRALDDNSLFSWAWIFGGTDASRVYLLIVAGLFLSYLLSRSGLPAHFQAVFLAASSFAAALPFWGEPELIVDAARYFTHAKHLEQYGIAYFLKEWGRGIPAWTDLPLVPFLYGLVFKLFGESRIAVQFFTTMMFSGTVVLTFLTGKRLWDRETGFSAGLLLLGSPYLLAQVPLMLVDVPTMFFLALAVYLFLEALNKGGAALSAGAAIAIALAALTKYSAWPMLSVLGVVLAAYAAGMAGAASRRALVRGAVVLLFGVSLFGAAVLWKFGVISDQLRLLREFQVPGLEQWGESYVSTFFYQIHPVIVVSALASAVLAVRKRDWRFAIICWLVVLVVLFDVKRIRYTLPAFPMLALMAGYGLRQIRPDDLRRFVLYGAVSSSLAVAVFAYLPFAGSMSAVNLKHAGAFLDSLNGGEVEVFTVAGRHPVLNPAVSVPLLDLHTGKKLRYLYLPGAAPPRREREQSSLRFTWEFRNPAYYQFAGTQPDAPIVVISDVAGPDLARPDFSRLDGYRLAATFLAGEGIFRHSTLVSVYQKPDSIQTRPEQ